MESVSGVGVLDKGVVILRALESGPADLADLQRRTGLPRATAHRLAVALESHGLVRRENGGRFCLGFELVRMGRAAAEQFPLGELSLPTLAGLRSDTGEGVQMYIREGDMRRCVVSLSSNHQLRWMVSEGALLPMDRGSAGKVLAAADDSTPVLLAESVEEREAGVASVSAAVVVDGRTIAAICVGGPVERLTRHPIDRYGDITRRAADQLGELLAKR